jgi:antitoxin Phd
MKSWSITEARTHIADVFDEALRNGPQRIERRDSEPVIVVAETIWRRLESEYPSFADLILNAPVEEEDLPGRRPARVIAGKIDA